MTTEPKPNTPDCSDFFESKLGGLSLKQRLEKYECDMINVMKSHDNGSFISDEEIVFPAGKTASYVADLQATILTVNPLFVTMTGYDKSELVGASNYKLRHPDMPKAALTSMLQSLENNGEWSGCLKYLRKDGGFYWANLSIVPLMCCDKHVGYTCTQTKVSEKKIKSFINLYKCLQSTESSYSN